MKLSLFYRWILFFLTSFITSFLLIFISEKIKFSHINLAPLGGLSWAVWFYPFAISFGIGISSKIFKLGRSITLFFSLLIILLAIFYILSNGLLFNNIIPFGINAKTVY